MCKLKDKDCNGCKPEVYNVRAGMLSLDPNVNFATGRRFDDPEEIEWAKKWQPEEPNQFQEITNSIADLLAYKNDKYGNSALNPLNIFTGKSKVGQRLDDKLSRVQNSTELRKNDIADILGYLILVCKENNWNTFEEFKD